MHVDEGVLAGVVGEHRVRGVRIRAYDSEAQAAAQREWEQTRVILKQDDRLPRGLESELSARRRVDVGGAERGVGNIGRRIDETEAEEREKRA